MDLKHILLVLLPSIPMLGAAAQGNHDARTQ
jgi:hypothetical protein